MDKVYTIEQMDRDAHHLQQLADETHRLAERAETQKWRNAEGIRHHAEELQLEADKATEEARLARLV